MSERNETESGSEVLSEYHADGLDHFPVRDMAEEIARLREALRIIADADVREMGRAGACTLSAIAREALGDE